MNVYWRSVIAMVALVALIAVAFVIMDDSMPRVQDGRVPESSSLPESADASESTDTPAPTREKERYFLTLEGDILSAYRISGSQKELIMSGNMTPLLMSDKDIQSLSSGIYADTFEDLCLYFESYAS